MRLAIGTVVYIRGNDPRVRYRIAAWSDMRQVAAWLSDKDGVLLIGHGSIRLDSLIDARVDI